MASRRCDGGRSQDYADLLLGDLGPPLSRPLDADDLAIQDFGGPGAIVLGWLGIHNLLFVLETRLAFAQELHLSSP